MFIARCHLSEFILLRSFKIKEIDLDFQFDLSECNFLTEMMKDGCKDLIFSFPTMGFDISKYMFCLKFVTSLKLTKRQFRELFSSRKLFRQLTSLKKLFGYLVLTVYLGYKNKLYTEDYNETEDDESLVVDFINKLQSLLKVNHDSHIKLVIHPNTQIMSPLMFNSFVTLTNSGFPCRTSVHILPLTKQISPELSNWPSNTKCLHELNISYSKYFNDSPNRMRIESLSLTQLFVENMRHSLLHSGIELIS
ncbi:unnamed protein product [Ambrosiozyma monospora]|uniref:Unnamed protein product n=1 Tax=Ambrosiozyma monospora TaxID=43982 RepID=A0ACB5SVA4_AMBMO|nr:unnamed protein product [Ambrosiozyma monospora]